MTTTTIENFEAALKDVVKSKKISQSKMNTLTDVALKCMDNDVQMVSMLYRTHRGLPTSAKGSSLYAVDALARAARNRVVKNKISGNLSSDKGNCATFLLRVEGILDGLFQDLLSSGSAELKEKAKKILDIWTKQNTFPSAVLSTLYSSLEEAEKNKEPDNAETTNAAPTEPPPPSVPALPPTTEAPTPQPPAAPPVDVHAVQTTLLALLSKVANPANAVASTQVPAFSQTAPNTAPIPPAAPVPALDANQLALLQQLAQTAKGNAVPSQPIPVPASVVPSLTTPNAVPVVPPVPGQPQPQPFPYRDDHHGAPAPHSESEHDRFDGPERGYPRDNYHDSRRDFRGGSRGHGRSGRGRGRGRWGDREPSRDRNREFGRDPRARRSRSRSPPGRYGGPGPRDARGHSPPGRGGYGPYAQRSQQGYGSGPDNDGRLRDAPEEGKDEFGRDLRPDSPETASVQPHQQREASPLPPGTGSVTASDRGSVASENAQAYPPANASSYPYSYPDSFAHAHPHSTGSSAPASLSPSASTTPLSPVGQRTQGGGGLDSFDRGSFDPSQPASWEALGKAWAVTHGAMPTQEELMQFVLGGVQLPPAPAAPGSYGSPAPQPPPPQSSTYQSPRQHSPRQQSPHRQYPPQHYPPQQSPQQRYPQQFGDDGQYSSPDRQWNRSQGSRGGWRGGPGGNHDNNFGGSGRGRGKGRDNHGRGGRNRGDHGRRNFAREEHGRGQYGHGNGPGAPGGRGGYQDHDTDAVMLGGGGDEYSWQDQQDQRQGYQGSGGQSYQGGGGGQSHEGGGSGQSYQAGGGQGYQGGGGQGYQGGGGQGYQGGGGQSYPGGGGSQSFQGGGQGYSQPPQHPPWPAQPQFQELPPQSQPSQAYDAQAQSPSQGGGGGAGRMQKVGDKWVFVRGTT